MAQRLSPTVRIRAQIDELFASDRDLGEILEDVARLGARLLLQTALEAEVPPSWAGTATSGSGASVPRWAGATAMPS